MQYDQAEAERVSRLRQTIRVRDIFLSKGIVKIGYKLISGIETIQIVDRQATREGNPIPRVTNESLPDLFARYDACNQHNVAQAHLGIRTSADLFRAAQSNYEQARAEKSGRWQHRTRNPRAISSHEVGARAEEVVAEEAGVSRLVTSLRRGKRQGPSSPDQPASKRARTSVRSERTDRRTDGRPCECSALFGRRVCRERTTVS